MKKQIRFVMLTGWLVPVGAALLFFALWVRNILVPTLKGGDFNQLYDLHGVRYLDSTLAFALTAFAWITIAVILLARAKTCENRGMSGEVLKGGG